MHERVRTEIDLLKARYPDITHDATLSWVMIPKHALPPGRFNLATTPVLFAIPTGYPNTGPDNFFVARGLRSATGESPPSFNSTNESSSGTAPVSGEWGWFSWHPTVWRPAAKPEEGDNLLTFVRGINMCLRGEDNT